VRGERQASVGLIDQGAGASGARHPIERHSLFQRHSVRRTGFAHMMNQQDRRTVRARDGPQVPETDARRPVTVFHPGMERTQRVEDHNSGAN